LSLEGLGVEKARRIGLSIPGDGRKKTDAQIVHTRRHIVINDSDTFDAPPFSINSSWTVTEKIRKLDKVLKKDQF
jgi:hypothetical protein